MAQNTNDTNTQQTEYPLLLTEGELRVLSMILALRAAEALINQETPLIKRIQPIIDKVLAVYEQINEADHG